MSTKHVPKADKPAQTDTRPMTQAQVRYARQRVEAICASKTLALQEADKELGYDSERVKTLLNSEVVAGRFTTPTKAEIRERAKAWKPGYEHYICRDLHSVLTFTDFPNGRADVEKVVAFARDKLRARIGRVRIAADKIMDRLVLGDTRSALSQIEAFERAEF